MPVVKRLTPEEVAALKLRPINAKSELQAQYDTLLADIKIGDFGELELSEEEQENKRQIRTLIQHAATRKGLRLTFKGMVGTDRLIFEAVPRNTGSGIGAYQALKEYRNPPVVEPPPAEVVASSVPIKKKLGRPPKVATNVTKA